MIEDDELRDLFKVECEEHLLSLDAGLLRLEKNPEEKAVLEEVFREAHSLKGAARMLGVGDVEVIAHHLEDELGAAHHGKQALTTEAIDRFYGTLDALRQYVDEAVTGKPAGLDLADVLAALAGTAPVANKKVVSDKPSPAKKPVASKKAAVKKTAAAKEPTASKKPAVSKKAAVKKPSAAHKEPVATKEPEPESGQPELEAEIESPSPDSTPPDAQGTTADSGGGNLSNYRISTMRVDPRKLDELMTHSGELAVTKSRVARRISAVNDLIDFREEWLKDVSSKKSEAHGLQSHASSQTSEKATREYLSQLGVLLNSLKAGISEDNTRLDYVTDKLNDGICSIRMLPFSTVFNLFPRMVRDLAQQEGKKINLVIEGDDISADKRVLEGVKDPLMHIIRNAIDHGIETPGQRKKAGKSETGTIRLKASQTPNNVVVEVVDDGFGLDVEAIKRSALKRKLFRQDVLDAMTPDEIYKLVFSSGLSTSQMITDVSGRGVGLDVVQTSVEQLKGSIEIESDKGCTIRLRLPVTMATIKVLIAEEKGCSYAIPVEFVETSLWLSARQMFPVEGRKTMAFKEQAVSIVDLADVLELGDVGGLETDAEKEKPNQLRPCIVLNLGGERLGLLADKLLDERDIVLKAQCALLKRVRNVSGATILGSGEVCMVLSPGDLIKSVRKREMPMLSSLDSEVDDSKRTILLAEDSITTRTQEKRILESAGYDVVTAVDGLDAWEKLKSQAFDAVVTDVQMPNMDGLSLAEKIRKVKKYESMPVILVTMLASDEDRQRGMDAGADAYISKPSFDQRALIETLERLM
jgi:two-component system chemotaxis sensor kinase CheA